MTPPTFSQLAATTPGALEAGQFVVKFNEVILFPLIMLLTGIALLFFIYGCVIYIANAENSQARETGRSHIIYSIVGLFVMLSAYGLLMIAANTFGLEQNLDCANDPTDPACDFIFMPNGSIDLDNNGGVNPSNNGGVNGANNGGVTI